VRDQITPLIIAYNEAPNIARTLGKLSWAKRIVVIDSGSTDETLDMLRRFPQVDVIGHPFSDFASQCNFGLTLVDTPWVLSLDADYELSDALVEEFAGCRSRLPGAVRLSHSWPRFARNALPAPDRALPQGQSALSQ
jgi:glycosyltransferase involved in cell wall biosynthesis